MGRDRRIILLGVGVLAVVFGYLFSRVLTGDVAIRSLDEVLAPEASALAPSRLKSVMAEMGEIDQSIAEDSTLLTADDAVPIHYQALMLAALAESLKKDVPREVPKAAHEDWRRMLDALILEAGALAEAASDPEKAEGPAIASAHKRLTRSCVVCHSAFGLAPSGEPEKAH